MSTADAMPTVSIRVPSPDGTVFVHVMEQNEKPFQITIHIGKAGSTLSAWADSLARCVTLLLQQDVDLFSIVAELSNITADRPRIATARSGPEAVAKALLKYANYKLGNLDELEKRGPSFGSTR